MAEFSRRLGGNDGDHGGAVAVELAAADAGDFGQARRARPGRRRAISIRSRRERSHKAATPDGAPLRAARRATPPITPARRDRDRPLPAPALAPRERARSRPAAARRRRKCTGLAPRRISAAARRQAPARHARRDRARPAPAPASWRNTESQPAAVELGADAEGLQPVVAEALDAFVVGAEQHVDEMMRAEALAGAIDCGERLLRGDRAVPGLPPAPGSCRNCRRAGDRARRNSRAAPGGGTTTVSQIAEQRLDLLPLDAALALVGFGRCRSAGSRFITSAMP